MFLEEEYYFLSGDPAGQSLANEPFRFSPLGMSSTAFFVLSSHLVTGKICLNFVKPIIALYSRLKCVVRQEFSILLNSPHVQQGLILTGCPILVLTTKISSVTVWASIAVSFHTQRQRGWKIRDQILKSSNILCLKILWDLLCGLLIFHKWRYNVKELVTYSCFQYSHITSLCNILHFLHTLFI